MRIERIELRLLRLPLVRFFETSFGRIHQRPFILVFVEGDGVTGVGECVAEANPYYGSETTGTAWHIIEEFIAPAVLGRDFAHPREIFPALRAIRGHRMAKAAVEMAAWDLFARQQGVPLCRALGGSDETIINGIASGVSIGIQDSIEELIERVEVELAAGYRRIKIKIKPGWDVEAAAAVRAKFGPVPLMVDANAAYHLEDAAHLARLDEFALMMIEQPLDYDDVLDHAALQRGMRTPICLDESLHTPKIAAEAIRAGACRIINIKPGRIGGHSQSIQMHDIALAHGVPVWHGGMLESGIGRAHNIHLSTLPGFSLPGDIAASRRYFAPDLIDPEVIVRPDGTIAVPTEPGIGVHLVSDRVAALTEQRLELRASA
ncbi:MAG: o-succinylbenzoate synthase [Acidobacteriota bacterium]|nr:o-succinylbenzoate synthase [Acidobacteriota bacterium]MDQ3418687.1 o-succinylbenzoate synthase [Acidobacteriota bacterium]